MREFNEEVVMENEQDLKKVFEEKLRQLDDQKAEIKEELRSILGEEINLLRVYQAKEKMLDWKIQEAIAGEDRKKEALLQAELSMLRDEQKMGRDKRQESKFSLEQKLEKLDRERELLVGDYAKKLFLILRESWYVKLFEVCDLHGSIIKDLSELWKATGVDIHIEHFKDGLRVTDHTSDNMWGGNKELFRRMRGVGFWG
jgi:hypothetical protein